MTLLKHTLSDGSLVKINVYGEFPPIPTRDYDYCAVTDDYDAWQEDDGSWRSSPIGRGATSVGAITDLIEQLEDV